MADISEITSQLNEMYEKAAAIKTDQIGSIVPNANELKKLEGVVSNLLSLRLFFDQKAQRKSH